MKSRILTAASVLTIALSGAAYAENNVPNTGDAAVDAKAEMKADWNNLKENTKKEWNDLKAQASSKTDSAAADTREAYQNTKARLLGEDGSATSLDVNARTSASGMIGKPVYNSNKDKVGTVSDIIVDHDGRAQLIVVSDGGFAGIGDKLAAFDYGLVVSQNANGDIFMPLTEELVAKVAPFSYDAKDADGSANVRLIPADGYSVAQLLKANLEDQQGKKIANIENITFDGGEIANLIVAYNQKLGLGGDKAAFDFDDVQITRSSPDDLNIRLNARQSAEFETFKNSKSN